jgi:hypothetical protein
MGKRVNEVATFRNRLVISTQRASAFFMYLRLGYLEVRHDVCKPGSKLVGRGSAHLGGTVVG